MDTNPVMPSDLALSHTVPLSDLFAIGAGGGRPNGQGFQRTRGAGPGGAQRIVDRFEGTVAACAFLRLAPGLAGCAMFTLEGSYQLQTCPAGGWLLLPSGDASAYWIPHAPRLRILDESGHITSDQPAGLAAMSLGTNCLSIGFAVTEGCHLDLAVWRMPVSEPDFLHALQALGTLETQAWFVYASHTRYTRPADFYLHLVHGHVYGNVRNWPKYWKLCDELDAWGLYLIASGLEKATGKRLYTLIKRQLVYSVIERQAEDGGWYHGEWTDRMESHYRLVNGAVLMLAAYLEEDDDERVRSSLEKACAFLVGKAQRIEEGVWFVHDSLEGDEEGMRHYPFVWSYSTALGKSPSNMLILNTHLDSAIALDRAREASGDVRHNTALESAGRAVRAVLGLHPAEWLYSWLFRILDLGLLPKEQAVRLPLPLRAIKRLGWKYLAPRLHLIKARLPRLVMPNGFIDRSLCQKDYSTRYQSVHVWDLVRYLRRFPEPDLRELLQRTTAYTHLGAIRAHWKEAPERQDALGFWVEALYHLCLLDPEPRYRDWLAQAILDTVDVNLGLPPSLLGGNPEAIPHAEAVACPSPRDYRLRVVNLSRRESQEILIVNTSQQALPLTWELPPAFEPVWMGQDGKPLPNDAPFPLIPSRGWLHAVATPAAGTSK